MGFDCCRFWCIWVCCVLWCLGMIVVGFVVFVHGYCGMLRDLFVLDYCLLLAFAIVWFWFYVVWFVGFGQGWRLFMLLVCCFVWILLFSWLDLLVYVLCFFLFVYWFLVVLLFNSVDCFCLLWWWFVVFIYYCLLVVSLFTWSCIDVYCYFVWVLIVVLLLWLWFILMLCCLGLGAFGWLFFILFWFGWYFVWCVWHVVCVLLVDFCLVALFCVCLLILGLVVVYLWLLATTCLSNCRLLA